MCRATFTVALPKVIPLPDEPDAGSGLHEFTQTSRSTAPAPAPALDKTDRLPSAGWHVMTPRGWVGPMHIVQVARAACLGKIRRTTLLCLDNVNEVIQAGALGGLFPAESPTARPLPKTPAPVAAEPAEPADADNSDPFDALARTGPDPAAALEQLAQ